MQTITSFLMGLLLLAFLTDWAMCFGRLRNGLNGTQLYIEIDYKYTWFEANHECARRNMQLVEIQNGQKDQNVRDILRLYLGTPKNLWMGANDGYTNTSNSNIPYYWSSTGNRAIYTNFEATQPDGGTHHCMHYWYKFLNYEWADGPCDSKYGFVCEVKATC